MPFGGSAAGVEDRALDERRGKSVDGKLLLATDFGRLLRPLVVEDDGDGVGNMVRFGTVLALADELRTIAPSGVALGFAALGFAGAF